MNTTLSVIVPTIPIVRLYLGDTLIWGTRPACSVEGCDQPPKSRGLCNKHHLQRWRAGELPPLAPKLCTINGCGRKHKGHGLCDMHAQQRRSGEIEASRRQRSYCLTELCANPATDTGYCEICVPIPYRCDHFDCTNPHHAYGLCLEHLQEMEGAPFFELPPVKPPSVKPDWRLLDSMARRTVTLRDDETFLREEILRYRSN